MNKLACFFALFIGAFSAFSQDTTLVTITNYKLVPGTFSWRGTGNFYKMTSWNSTPYTQGHLRRDPPGPVDEFIMNYRLLFPNQGGAGYDPNYSPGYPMIVMMHGGGERGNCWNNGGDSCPSNSCYYLNSCWDPNDQPAGNPDVRLLNNDHNLLHGGQPHLNAVNLAGTKLPDDPTLAQRAFPGFVLFPQNTNGWTQGRFVRDAIRIIRLLIKEHNIDPNRIYVHGLSNGGYGTYSALREADWLFAAAAPMSAVNSVSLLGANDGYNKVSTIPLWIFQGGTDGNPTPNETETLIRNVRTAGGSVRYSKYPNLGHGIWNNAYNEPDFFSWLLSKNKANIHVDFGSATICGPTGQGASLRLAQGFPAYQWERDGQIISGATSATYIATIPGIYRARFSRTHQIPNEQQWNRWSDPVTVTEKFPAKAEVDQIGTVVTADLNNFQGIILHAKDKDQARYYWYVNGVQMNVPDTTTVFQCLSGPCKQQGNGAPVTLRMAGFDNCQSPASDPKYAFYGGYPGGAPATIDRPDNFQAHTTSPSSVLLTWRDNSTNERGFEIWRRKSTDPSNAGHVLAVLTGEDVTSFHDTGLEPNTQYWYKIRAVSNNGRSNYWPSNDRSVTNQSLYLIVNTGFETNPPTPPQNVTAAKSGINEITLTWEAAQDDSGIKEYIINYGSASVSTGSNQLNHTISGLVVNTLYNFTVQAVDLHGNISAQSNQATENTYYQGLYYEHSTGVWTNNNDGTSFGIQHVDFSTAEFKGAINNFDIVSMPPRTQDDFFNFKFDGYLYIRNPGTYRFRLESEDGSRLFINGIQRANVATGGANESGNFSLTQGPHRITVLFYEYANLEQWLRVFYRRTSGTQEPGTTFVQIPDNRLYSYDHAAPPQPPTPPLPPANLSAYGVSMTQNSLSWTSPTSSNPYKVVVLGSSTAAGTGATPSDSSWVTRFSAWLTAVAPGSSVINRAKNGYDSYDIVPGATDDPTRTITYALAQNPNMIIVNLPSNDTNNGISIEETMDNFRLIKSLADAQGVKIFFTTTQPRNFSNLALRDELQQQADSIRAAFGNYVIDIYDELTDFSNNKAIKAIYSSGDGIHLNNAGHKYIYSVARNTIELHLINYEVHRALSETGNYTMLLRTTETGFEDNNLAPGTTYYYKVRSVDVNGHSVFTPTVSATTLSDPEIPSTPTGLIVTATTFTTVSLVWNPSTDNVGVAGYEIFANGELIGTSPIFGYLAANLSPGVLYNFTVRAFDAAGNRSNLSAVASTTTPSGQVYYATSSTNLNILSSWHTNPGGPGTNPPGFDYNGQQFVVTGTNSFVGGSWSVEGGISKVIVPDGIALTVNNSFSGRVEVQGTGAVTLNNATIPQFISLAVNSTVQYGSAAFIQPNNYGNLVLGGSGNKTFFADTTTVNGNLIINGNIALKGAPGNATRLQVGGNVTVNGTPQFVADDFGIKLELTGNGTQTITSNNDLYLAEIITSGTGTVNVVSATTPYNIRLGGEASGGLTLGNGSKLNVGNNTLLFKKKAVVNAGNENGRIAINEGSILFTSTEASASNLYFDPAANSINRFEVDLQGGGSIVVRETARVTDGLKIHNGTLNANGQLMLASTATKTANLEIIETNGQVAGNLIVQRHMEPEGRIWKYISTPVAGVTVADWQQSGLPVTGDFTGASTGPGLGSSPSLYYYNETQGGWVAYPSPQPGGNNTAPIQRGVGYSAFVRKTDGPTILEVSGNPYQQNVPFTLTGGTGADTGWNLLGNPYASTIVWNNTGWLRSGLSSAVAVRDNPSGQLMIWDASTGIGNLPGGKIAPGQAFWVQAIAANPSLTITEQAKSVEQQEFYREGSNQEYAVVKLVRGTLEDPAFILFNTTSDNYEANADAYKRPNEGMFSLSTLTADGVQVAINKLNETFCSKTIHLKFENVTAGQYKLVVENITSLSRIQQVVLRDNLLNTTVWNDAEYTFDITSDPATFSTDRFTLTFQRSDMVMPTLVSASPVCAEDFSTITLAGTEYGTRYAVVNQANEVIAGPFDGAAGNTTLQVAAEMLAFGANALRLQVTDAVCDGTPVILPNQIQVVRNTRPAVTVNSYQTICEGSSATLTATGSSGTTGYQWYTLAGEKTGTGYTWETPVLTTSSIFKVAAIGTNGCEGEAKAIIVLTEQVAVPEITVSNDTLYTQYNSNLQWYKDGQPLFNENKHYLIPQQTGAYRVTATSSSGECTQLSNEVVFAITSTEHGIGGINDLIVFPNPASHEALTVVFYTSEQEPVELKLVDTFGRTVYQQQFSSEEAQHGVVIQTRQPLAAGLYMVVGTQGNSSKTKKLIIKQ